MATDDYVDRYSVAALLQRADNFHGAKAGTKDGQADQAEIAAVVKEFDKGSTNPKSKAIAGNNVLERDEIKEFNRNYEEKNLGEFDPSRR